MYVYIFTALLVYVIISITCYLLGPNKTDKDLVIFLHMHNLPDIFASHSSGYSLFDNYSKVHSIEYGEITLKGMKKIKNIADANNIDIFYDFGSGIGKSVVMASLLGFKHTIGIELVKERHNTAQQILSKLPKSFQESIELLNGDVLELNIQTHQSNNVLSQSPSIIFISNITWPNKVTKAVFSHIIHTFPKGTIIVASKFATYDKDKHNIVHLGKENIPMSWDKNAMCYSVTVKK